MNTRSISWCRSSSPASTAHVSSEICASATSSSTARQHRRVEWRPAAGVRTLGDAFDVVVGESEVARDVHVLAPLVLDAAHALRRAGQQLALTGARASCVEDVTVERVVRLHQRRVLRERPEDVESLGATLRAAQLLRCARRKQRGDAGAHVFAPLVGRQRWDAGPSRRHCTASFPAMVVRCMSRADDGSYRVARWSTPRLSQMTRSPTAHSCR